MSDLGRIYLHRKILGWEWYADINTCRLFIHMLLKANWKEGKFKGTTVPRGSFISSISKLAEETGLTNDEVRTAISHLMATNEITKQSTNKYTVFVVVNYNLYQDTPKQEHNQGTGNAQAIPKLFPTIEESNKGNKEIKEDAKASKKNFHKMYYPNDEELNQAFADYVEMRNLGQQIEYAENDLSALVLRHDELIERQNRTANGYKELKKAIQKFGALGKSILSLLQKSVKSIENGFKKLGETAKKSFTKVNKTATGTNNIFQTGLKNILKYGLGIRSLYALVSKFRTAVKEGFGNLYGEVEGFKNSVDNLRASALTLKNAFAAAFRPLVETAIPYIQKMVDYITILMDKFGQLMAAITGRKTYTRAIKQTADAFKDEAEAVKETVKELEGYLGPLDEINKYATSKKDADKDKEIEEIKAPMFEEVPIDSYFLDLAERIKDIFSQLFAPLKEAWNREGKFVMDSWKYALREVWDLIKSIGSDFLEVWQQEKNIKIFEDLLHIIGDIGLVVGNLAHNFRLAWEENETGKRILEGVRDIIGVIVANIRHAADATVEWSKNLNFSPFLTRMQAWIESLIPVFDALSGIITDFYEHVLLPLGKWVLEKGLPDLLQIFIDFNNKVDWDGIRARLVEFWKHLEPFVETVGQGLIIFIGRLSDALARFMNSPAFDKFLTTIENWMDNVKPEDVADALESIAKAIIALKVAVLGFSVISKGLIALSNLVNILKFFGAGGVSSAIGGIKSIGTAISGWIPHIAVGAAIASVLGKIKEAMEATFDTSNWSVLDWIGNTLEASLNGWKSEFEGFKISLELWWQDTWMSDAIWRFGQWWNEKVAPWFTQEKWSELWENVNQSVLTKWEEVKTSLSTKIEEIKTDISIKMEEIRTSLLAVWENIKIYILNNWESIKQSAIDIWNSIRQFFVDTWSGITTTISETWENIKKNVKESAENVKTNIVNAWTKVKEDTSEAWNNIKENAVSLAQSMYESIKEKFENLQVEFSNFSSNVQSVWGNAWEGMQEKVTSIIDSVKSAVESAFNWIADKVESMKEKLSSVGSKAKSIFDSGSSVIKFTSSIFNKKSSGYSFASAKASLYSTPAFAALNNVEIPKLATGAVIPANREFLAVLGDQKHGTNVEAPLDTIKQANRESLLEVLSELGVTGSRGNEKGNIYNVKALAHSKVLFELMIEEGKIQQMSTGNNPFLLRTT